jgi:hypothetical protein
MGLRKYKRAIIKARCIDRDGNARNFPYEWNKYRNTKVVRSRKYGSWIVNKTNTTKNNKHYDNGNFITRRINAIKQMMANKKSNADKD